MATMKKKTVNVPGIGPTELHFGPGFLAIDDLLQRARIEAQGYTLAELQAATTQGRQPVPLYRQAVSYEGADYIALRELKSDFVTAVQVIAWDGLTRKNDTPGPPDDKGNPTLVNFFHDAVDETF